MYENDGNRKCHLIDKHSQQYIASITRALKKEGGGHDVPSGDYSPYQSKRHRMHAGLIKLFVGSSMVQHQGPLHNPGVRALTFRMYAILNAVDCGRGLISYGYAMDSCPLVDMSHEWTHCRGLPPKCNWKGRHMFVPNSN
jgi:hypothetical protein